MKGIVIFLVLFLSFLTGLSISQLNPSRLDIRFKTTFENIENWDKTKLTFSHLKKIINDKNCFKNEKNKIACINGILSILEEEKLSLDIYGNFITYKMNLVEKEYLSFWKNKKILFSFDKKINEIQLKTDQNSIPYFVGVGINGYLSIKLDPHSQIKQNTQKEQSQNVFLIQNKKTTTLKIKSFKKGVCTETKEKLNEITKNKTTNLILDLTGNSGGYVHEATCISGLFLGKVFIIRLEEFSGKSEDVFSLEDKIYFGKLSVLVDETSASASEILAGALKTNKRAKIIGNRTFGKGTYQESSNFFIPNTNVIYFKTKGFYYFKNGFCPQLIGIAPDIEESSDFEYYREEDLYFSPLNQQNKLTIEET